MLRTGRRFLRSERRESQNKHQMSSCPLCCPNCGVVLYQFSRPHDSSHHYEYWRCVRCGHEEGAVLRPGEIHVEPEFTLTLTWPGDTSLKEVRAVRMMDPIAAAQPLADLVSTLRQTRNWVIHSMSHEQVCEAVDACKRAGLTYEVT